MKFLNNLKHMVCVFVILVSYSQNSRAGEVTATEWDIVDDLIVTYYIGNMSSNGEKVSCTVFSDQTPIGGGVGYTQGGIAQVRVDVPTSYVRAALTIQCQP